MQTQAADIDISKINQQQLPKSLRELINAIGLRTAFVLVERYGGLKLYIPFNATTENAVGKVIGLEALQKLIDIYAGMHLDLPKFDKVLIQIKHNLAREMIQENYSTKDIASTLNYTERRVWQLKAETANSNQSDLFK